MQFCYTPSDFSHRAGVQPADRARTQGAQRSVNFGKKGEIRLWVLIFPKNGTYIACVDARGQGPWDDDKGKVVSHGTT